MAGEVQRLADDATVQPFIEEQIRLLKFTPGREIAGLNAVVSGLFLVMDIGAGAPCAVPAVLFEDRLEQMQLVRLDVEVGKVGLPRAASSATFLFMSSRL